MIARLFSGVVARIIWSMIKMMSLVGLGILIALITLKSNDKTALNKLNLVA